MKLPSLSSPSPASRALRRTLVAAVPLAACITLHGPAQALSLSVQLPRIACADLVAERFDQTPGAPFRLSTAEIVPVSATNPSEYCRVTGTAMAQVNFEVRLPTGNWTQRMIFSTPGGYAGSAAGASSLNFPAQLAEAFNCPLMQSGEMVRATTDNGHLRKTSGASAKNPGAGADGLFALHNPQGLIDFAYAGTHKATIAVKAVIKAYYGQGPRFSYLVGCSNGGRNALMEAQRYPDDYDGILAGSATIDDVQTNTFYHAWNFRVNSAGVVPGTNPPQYNAILTNDKLPALEAAVLAACGRFEGGLRDQIQDPRACQFDARALICRGPETASCLTPAQAQVVNLVWQGPVDQYGKRMTAGQMLRGSELSWGSVAPAPGVPISFLNSSEYTYSWDWPHWMSRFGDPLPMDHDTFRFTREEYRILTQLDPLINSTNPDLRPFAAQGGKLLMWQGWADTGSAPHDSLNYYDAVHRLMGHRAANDVMRLYMVPAMGHCNGGARSTRADFLSALVAWVEDGVSPNKVNVTYWPGNNVTVPPTMTRPSWPYPTLAKYDGAGDPNDPGNFVPTAPSVYYPARYDYLGIGQYTEGYQWTCKPYVTTSSYEYRCGPLDRRGEVEKPRHHHHHHHDRD